MWVDETIILLLALARALFQVWLVGFILMMALVSWMKITYRDKFPITIPGMLLVGALWFVFIRGIKW